MVPVKFACNRFFIAITYTDESNLFLYNNILRTYVEYLTTTMQFACILYIVKIYPAYARLYFIKYTVYTYTRSCEVFRIAHISKHISNRSYRFILHFLR